MRGLGERFRKRPHDQAVRGAYRSRTGASFRNERLDQAENRAERPHEIVIRFGSKRTADLGVKQIEKAMILLGHSGFGMVVREVRDERRGVRPEAVSAITRAEA